LNRLGYMLVKQNRLDDAIEILKLNVSQYPKSWNVYDSLGEAYLKKGENQLAIKNYEKALELNPQSDEFEKKEYARQTKVLKELKGKRKNRLISNTNRKGDRRKFLKVCSRDCEKAIAEEKKPFLVGKKVT
jgi:tetratricopeptide (TPR) repeat protein